MASYVLGYEEGLKAALDGVDYALSYNPTKIAAAACLDEHDNVWWLPQPARHAHVLWGMYAAGAKYKPGMESQGFLTTEGKYVDRIKGADVALSSGQIEKLQWGPNLFSEDLW